MSLISAGSISLDSTFNYYRAFDPNKIQKSFVIQNLDFWISSFTLLWVFRLTIQLTLWAKTTYPAVFYTAGGGGCVTYGFPCGLSRTIPPPYQSFPKQSTVNFTNPPAHPRIVAAKAAYGWLGEGFGYGSWELRVYYTPFRLHSAPMHLVS